MAWPLTGSALTKYNRLLSDLRQYGDFIFVGAPDDITWLQETIVAASDGVLRPNLDDVANRSHYWMLRAMAFFADASAVAPTPSEPCPECPPVVPCPPCPSFFLTTIPSGLENEFGVSTFGGIVGLTGVILSGTSLGGADIESQVDLISVSVPDLVIADGVAFILSSNNALTSFSLPVLTTVDNAASFDVSSNSALTSFSLPALTTVDNSAYVAAASNSALTSFSLPALTTVDNFAIVRSFNNDALTSFSLPALATVANGASIDISGNNALTSVSLGSAIFGDGTDYNFSGNALTDVSVNYILARAVANVGYVSGTINTSGGTNAAPTGQGIVDKATLIGRGVTVTTN